jgi:hypothetical protein
MHRMNFSQPLGPEKDARNSHPVLLFFASAICTIWLVETILQHMGI